MRKTKETRFVSSIHPLNLKLNPQHQGKWKTELSATWQSLPWAWTQRYLRTEREDGWREVLKDSPSQRALLESLTNCGVFSITFI